MLKFRIEDLFQPWFKVEAKLIDEEALKSRLTGLKSVTQEYKEGNMTIKTTTYKGEGFSYSITTFDYEANEIDSKIYKLKDELDKAVEEFRYEDAVKLRDEIKSLKTSKTTKDNE